MKPRKLTIALFAAAQMSAANFVSAQTAPATPVAALTPPGPPPFGRPNLSVVLSRMLLLTEAQKAQLQPYLDAVQPQLDATRQQARQTEDALLKQLHASIRPLLTPEQQTKLDALEAMRLSGPPPSPPLGRTDLWEGFERGSQ
jgi:Spy/CpxP family protein refolding chaperone